MDLLSLEQSEQKRAKNYLNSSPAKGTFLKLKSTINKLDLELHSLSGNNFCFKKRVKEVTKNRPKEQSRNFLNLEEKRTDKLSQYEMIDVDQFFYKFLDCQDLKSILTTINSAVKKILKPDLINIFMGTAAREYRLVYTGNRMLKRPEMVIKKRQSLIIKRILKERKVIYLQGDECFFDPSDPLLRANSDKNRAVIITPMCNRNGVIGIIAVYITNSVLVENYKLNALKCIANVATITSEKVHYIEEQRDMQSALDRHGKLIAMGRIVAGVAHEVNNPLSIMQLDVDELKINFENRNFGEENRELLNSLQEEIERMSTIIRQLKDYSKPEEAVENGAFVDIVDLFYTYPIKIFIKNLRKKRITVETDFFSDQKLVRIPRYRIIQVLMNLLSNADEAIFDKEHGYIHITVYSERKSRNKENIVITISDNGEGIASDNLQNIFDPFYTTKIGDGTGLGLSISYSIVKRYNGEIKVKSVAGEGTTFSVIFPVISKKIKSNEEAPREYCLE